MKAYGTSYLFNAKKIENKLETLNFGQKNAFYAKNFMSIFSQNLEISLRILNRSPQI